MVGPDIRSHVYFDRMEQSTLPNGSIEYRVTTQIVRRGNPRTRIFEVDPRTYIIQRADFAGAPNDCVIDIGWPG
jgi:dihydroorotate dehydrogenase